MRQGTCLAIGWTAAVWLTVASPAWAHPDPATHAGAVAYLVAAGITAAIVVLIVWGRRLAAVLKSAFRSR